MLPTDVIIDVMSKMPFMQKVYSLYYYYHTIDYTLPSNIFYLMDRTFYWLLSKNITANPKFDGYTFKEIYDVINQWNSTSLVGTYIYRGTSAEYIQGIKSGFLTSGGAVPLFGGKLSHLTYWSYFPASALIFASASQRPVLLVAKYDSRYCSPDDYFLVNSELSGIVDGRLYNYGGVKYLREMEIRCYEFPASAVKYVLKGNDLLDLFNMLLPVYRKYMDERDINDMRQALEVR